MVTRARSVRLRATLGLGALVLTAATGSVIVAATGPGAVAQAPEPPRTGSFSALSYNVAGLPVPFSGSEPDINTVQISPKLNAYEVVLVQEDWVDPVPPVNGIDFHHDDLISAVTHPYLSAPAQPPLGTDPRRPEALVADGLNYLSRLPFGTVYRQMWPGCFGGADTSDGGAADCLSLKGFSVTRLQVDNGLSVDLYNLHAEAGSTPTDNQWSAADYVVLAEFINQYSVNQSIILGGDTNLSTGNAIDGPVWATFLAATGITDVCDVLACGADADSIDKFAFRDGPIVDLTPTSHRFEVDVFVRAGDGAPLSDHDALAVNWSWTAPAPADTPTVTTLPLPVNATPTTAPTTSTTRPVVPVVQPAFTG